VSHTTAFISEGIGEMPSRHSIICSLLLLPLLSALPLCAQDLDRGAVVRAIDAIMNEPIEAGQIAGASVAVVQGTDTILLKAYGFADLEFHVPTPERAIYEIGSVTKQFTAVAILQLVAEGSLDLDAVFTEYLPDYPADGHGITVRRLLDHTSGIRGYTEMPGFGAIATRDLPRDSLVVLFSAAPLDFPPGEALIYNNSAYFLLGVIVEAVSGESYEEYVRSHLFEPVGMPDSRYCSENAIVERRAHGYDARPDGLVRKGFIDHTWPYAAGSLCSTAWDLVAWNQALYGDGTGGRLLGVQGYNELITPGTLSDGTPLRYAKGLSVYESGGRRVIGHGGGIPGFLSQVTYYPEEDLSVIVLLNTAGPTGPGVLANEIANKVLGEPADPQAVTYSGSVVSLMGTYRGAGRGSELVVTIDSDSDGLRVAFGDGEPASLRYLNGLTFGRGNTRFTFVMESGVVDRLQVDQMSGLYVLKPDPR
jgi:CubicO group peptidase (beta-lactamase class C family)